MDVDKRNEELDETIIQTCKWIQKKLQISDKSIRDEKVPEMMSALAELVAARAGETITPSLATRVLKNFAISSAVLVGSSYLLKTSC